MRDWLTPTTKPLGKIDDALAIPEEERGLAWHLTTLDQCYKLMRAEEQPVREKGETLFMEIVDPAIRGLRSIGAFSVYEEVRIWYHAMKNQIPEKQGYTSIVEWVQARGEVGFWFNGPLPNLSSQTIRAYLRVYEFWCMEWGIETMEMGKIPFGKLRDCLSFARTLKKEDREEFMGFLLQYPRSEIVARYQASKAPPPPQLPEESSPVIDPDDLLSKETALGPEPPEWLQVSSTSQARRFYLDWKSGRLWAAQPGSESLMIGVVGRFNRKFLTEANLLVNWLREEGVEADVMDENQIEDALLEFCRRTGIQHD